MMRRTDRARSATYLLTLLASATFLTVAPVNAQSSHPLLGGPKGVVKSAKGDLLEGMMVQLISQKNTMRTTVYSDADGRYEVPELETCAYTLRISQPREVQHYAREQVQIVMS